MKALDLQSEIERTFNNALHVQVAGLREKYRRLFDADEERPNEIRAAHQ